MALIGHCQSMLLFLSMCRIAGLRGLFEDAVDRLERSDAGLFGVPKADIPRIIDEVIKLVEERDDITITSVDQAVEVMQAVLAQLTGR